MWSSGYGGGAAGGIPATSPASLAGEVAREGPGVERAQWGCSFVAGRHGRRGLAVACAARGARGVGEGGGATHGRSTAHGPAGQSRPRRAVRRRTGGLRGACVATSCASVRALALGAPAQFHLGMFNCKYL
jgi:hypothetical protein